MDVHLLCYVAANGVLRSLVGEKLQKKVVG
jgi:hypothetical protein